MQDDLKCLILKLLSIIRQIGSGQNNRDFGLKNEEPKKVGTGRLE